MSDGRTELRQPVCDRERAHSVTETENHRRSAEISKISPMRLCEYEEGISKKAERAHAGVGAASSVLTTERSGKRTAQNGSSAQLRTPRRSRLCLFGRGTDRTNPESLVSSGGGVSTLSRVLHTDTRCAISEQPSRNPDLTLIWFILPGNLVVLVRETHHVPPSSS